jgi:hypothetical protein
LLEEASAAASKAVDQAREAGKHAGETLIPEVRHVAERASGQLSSQRHNATSTINTLTAAATDSLAHTTGAIEHKSKHVATAAGRGTKDAGAFVLWTSAAAGIAYYAFLGAEQRAKVKQSGQRIAREIREVYQDIRGYDGQFTQ